LGRSKPPLLNTTYDPTSFTGAGPHLRQLKRQESLHSGLQCTTAIHDALPTGCASASVRCSSADKPNIQAQHLQSQFGKAGAYGGSRQGVAEAELQRGLLDRMAGITGTGYQQAFEQAQNQFNEEATSSNGSGKPSLQRYGLDVLREQQDGGAGQRAIESQGIGADIAQFEQERDYPFKNVQFMQSLLQGQPLETQSYSYSQPTGLESLVGGIGGVKSTLDTINEYLGI
jgi:hypothetical protein